MSGFKLYAVWHPDMNSAVQMGSKADFRTFKDLEVYQHAREFRKAMYAVARELPEFEKFALATQIRRAAVSLTNNLAEGHGRHHYLDQLRFVLHARGSLEELVDDLNVCFDERYLSNEQVQELKQSGWRLLNLINGYGRYLRTRKAESSATLHDIPLDDELMNEHDPF
jgi:four helix bundle protein